MGDYILIEGDTVQFDSSFVPPAAVMVQPGKLTGSGPATIGGKKICVQGDEGDVSVPCSYTTLTHSVPGTGYLEIAELATDQVATKTNTGDKAVLLRGKKFQAQFRVEVGAKEPPPKNTPDTATTYKGTGSFITTNTLFQGT